MGIYEIGCLDMSIYKCISKEIQLFRVGKSVMND